MRLHLVTRCNCRRYVDILDGEDVRPPQVYDVPLHTPPHFLRMDEVPERLKPGERRRFVLESRIPTAPWEVPSYVYREE